MEHTANKMQDDKGLISSLLRIFFNVQIRLSFGDKDLDTLSLKCINFKILPSQVEEKIGAEVAVNSDLVMLFYTNIPSTSNTLKNLSNYHSSYTNQEFNTKK